MAVKNHTRQLTLFSTSVEQKKLRTIEVGKKCSKCGEFKTPDQYYKGKERSGNPKLMSACRKCCLKRHKEKYKKTTTGRPWEEVFGVEHGVKLCSHCGVDLWGQKGRLVCIECVERLKTEGVSKRNPRGRQAYKQTRRQDLESKGLWEWYQVAMRCMHALQSRIRNQQKGEWEKRCGNAVVAIRQRTFKGTGRDIRKCMTWNQRCIAAKYNLKAVLKRPHQAAWIKKCATAAMSLRRRQLRKNHRCQHTSD